MRLSLRLGLAALVTLALAGTASAAGPVRIVEAGGSAYPDRSYILTLPSPKSLSRSDVSVTENGQRVANKRLARQGTNATGSAIVLAIDSSASMQGKAIVDAVAAARVFAAAMGPQQQVAVITFNNKVKLAQKFTTNKAQVQSALASIPKLAVGTKIYDSLDQGLKLIEPSGAAGAVIVLLSDGTDVGSSTTAASAIKELKAEHVRVFSVGLATHTFDRKALETVASSTGGSFVEAASPSQLKAIYQSLGQQISSEYLLSYRSRQNPSTKVKVRVVVKGVPGEATSEYRTPALHLLPPQPYNPSTADRVIQSPYTMIGIALLFAALVGFAVSRTTSGPKTGVVERVGVFVSVRRQRAAATEGKKRPTPRHLLTRMSAATSRASWSERLADALQLADIAAEPIQVVILTTTATILAMVVFGFAIGWFGILAALTVPLIVRSWILSKISRKRRAFADQLPDNLEVLASALRAGHSLVGALSVVAADAAEPSKSELQRVIADEQFGVNLEIALEAIVVRMENTDLEQVALVARLQREVGSNSAEVLDRVVENVRAKMELRRLVRTLTAQGRLSRWILTLLPVAIALGMTLISQKYMAPLFDTGLGRFLLAMAVVMVVLGSWIIGRIVDVRV